MKWRAPRRTQLGTTRKKKYKEKIVTPNEEELDWEDISTEVVQSAEILTFEDTREFLQSEDQESEQQMRNLSAVCPSIKMQVAGIEVDALVDTGSRITCIKQELYLRFADHFKKFPTLPVANMKRVVLPEKNRSGLKFNSGRQ